MDEQRPTLQITWPFGLTPALALLLLATSLGLLEGLLRIPALQALLPPPSRGTGHAQFEVQYQNFIRYQRAHPELNCIIMGSSQTWAGIDPEKLRAAYLEAGGQPLDCFNFGVQVITSAEAATLAELAIRETSPRVVIYGLSVRDLAEYEGSLINRVSWVFQQNPWIRYRLGTFTLSGWLTEHSAAYGYYLTFRARLSEAEWRTRQDAAAATREDGFRVVPFGNNVGPILPDRAILPEFYDALGDYRPSPERLAGLDQILSLQNENLRVIVIEVPLPDATIAVFSGGKEAYPVLFSQPLRERVAASGALYLNGMDAGPFPDEEWADFDHLNTDGASHLSRWLGERLAEELTDAAP
ncbi:MAG: hypothetical protein IT326_07620 [Anaerolineae bacterium]|nr:hypothetical protein [Anaerolineae bacterium]